MATRAQELANVFYDVMAMMGGGGKPIRRDRQPGDSTAYGSDLYEFPAGGGVSISDEAVQKRLTGMGISSYDDYFAELYKQRGSLDTSRLGNQAILNQLQTMGEPGTGRFFYNTTRTYHRETGLGSGEMPTPGVSQSRLRELKSRYGARLVEENLGMEPIGYTRTLYPRVIPTATYSQSFVNLLDIYDEMRTSYISLLDVYSKSSSQSQAALTSSGRIATEMSRLAEESRKKNRELVAAMESREKEIQTSALRSKKLIAEQQAALVREEAGVGAEAAVPEEGLAEMPEKRALPKRKFAKRRVPKKGTGLSGPRPA